MKENERGIQLYIAPVVAPLEKRRTAFRAQARILDRELGLLLPDTYTPVTDRTIQSKRLFDWTVEETLLAAQRLVSRAIEFDFISVYAPQKLLEDDKAVSVFIEIIKNSGIEASGIAIEVYPDLLLEKDSKVFGNVSRLREHGIKCILLGYASENFPLSRAAFMPADIFCLDNFATECLEGDDNEKEYALGAISIAKNIGKKLMSDTMDTKERYRSLGAYFDYCAGAHLGNYIKHRYVKVKWIEKFE